MLLKCARPWGFLGMLLVLSWAPAWAQEQGLELPESPPGETESSAQGDPPAASRGLAAGPGHGSLEFRLGFYDTPDSGDGNPFLDEELTVIEPVIIFDYAYSERLLLHGTFSYDFVSSASIDRLSNFPDQSGASGDNYLGLDLGFVYLIDDDWSYGGFLSASTEYDYQSLGLGGHVTRNLAEKNATVKVSLNGFFDSIDVIRFDGTEESDDERLSLSSTVNYYQVFDPRTHGEFGFTFTFQDGFLETPYNAVVIEDSALAPNPNLDNNARGLEVVEELPDSRVRGAIFGRVRHSLSDLTSVELGTRLYTDSWGISSVAVEPRLYRWLVKDVLSARLRYRFYLQTEADDYQDRFFAAPKERTQDSDLADFTSHTVGVRFDWHAAENMRFDIGVDYLLREDDLNQLMASIGLLWEF